ncbi:MAG: TRAM domain-containing protein [Acidobacteriota bacterium]
MNESESDDVSMAEAETTAVEVELHDTATDGRGVGRLPGGKVVFVEGALGGECVTVRLERETRRMAEGTIQTLLKQSEMRQNPPCSQAERCGGCQLQHVTQEDQLTLKKQWLIQTLRRIGGWSSQQIDHAERLLRCHQARPLGYRVRARWHFDGATLGFFARRSHQVVSSEECLLLTPPLMVARSTLLAQLTTDELTRLYRRAGLVDVQFEATLLRNQAVVLSLGTLSCRRPQEKSTLQKTLQLLVKEWNGIQVDDQGFADVPHPECEPFRVGAQVFVQPHFEALSLYRAEILDSLRSLLKQPEFSSLERKNEWAAWDLYCGAGALSDLPGRAAGTGRQVTTWSVDGEAAAVAALQLNHPALAAHSLQADVREFIRNREDEVLLPDILICDPPRDGLGLAAAGDLSRLLADRGSPTALIWLACDNASLARDLKPFLDAGFKLHSMALFDCFTYTIHAETVVLLGSPGSNL